MGLSPLLLSSGNVLKGPSILADEMTGLCIGYCHLLPPLFGAFLTPLGDCQRSKTSESRALPEVSGFGAKQRSAYLYSSIQNQRTFVLKVGPGIVFKAATWSGGYLNRLIWLRQPIVTGECLLPQDKIPL